MTKIIMNWKKIMSRFFKNLHNSSSAFGRIFVNCCIIEEEEEEEEEEEF